MLVMDTPRPEHPRPQLTRKDWINLNGAWQFEIDQGDSGFDRGLLGRDLDSTIVVPFAPESALSGVANTDFLQAVWYRRTVKLPSAWAGKDYLLHFGAVDHDATVWANGIEVARHRGGFSSFTANLTRAVGASRDVTIVVRARDLRQEVQARGKQATWHDNSHWQYTRTTGIWQTVWLEAVPTVSIRKLEITPNFAASSFRVVAPVTASRPGWSLRIEISDANGVVSSASVRSDLDLAPELTVAIPADRARPWSTADPHLYQLSAQLLNEAGDIVDEVDSYAGLRSISIDGQSLKINGEALFQRLVLDQGYWSDSLMTAPSDSALVRDIELAMAAGFNGARLHQKVFEERYFYHADRLGFIVWAEFGDWGVSGLGPQGANQQPTSSFVSQWLEILDRDANHPSIIGWCPLNETHQLLHDRITVLDDVTRAMFLATKLADPTRPVIDASGYSHRVLETDVYDSHSYEQDPQAFAIQQAGLADGAPWINHHSEGAYSTPYLGQPYFVSEFGGIWWNPDHGTLPGDDWGTSWGYGRRVDSEEEYHARFKGLVDTLLDNPLMFGYCYTQLTDVFQEQNGIYRFDRSAKFDVGIVKDIQSRTAAYEMTDAVA